MKTNFIIVSLTGLLATSFVAFADETVAASGEDEHWLFGKWEGLSGIWQHRSNHQLPPIIVELDLRPGEADGTVEGTRKMHVASTREIVYGEAASTKADVSGQYDDVTQSVRLSAGADDATYYVFDGQTNALAGCLDGTTELAGTGGKASRRSREGEAFPYFVLWRDQRAEQLVQDYLAKVSAYRSLPPVSRAHAFAARRGAAPSPSDLPAESQNGWQAPTVEKLNQWAAAASK